ncbi:MAG: hypothetical protein CVU39_20470 [Chloroflexi bacterium HGW-Chloroflexi-10]|nr:MAG: hypothetical protein CVU39_20470 [Chloroflexi bacterium HGW-Chloroflexi-10]
MNQFIWAFVSFVITLMIFSYLLGDNPLFKIATYIFVGVTSAYVMVQLVNQIIIPRLVTPFLSGDTSILFYTLAPTLLSLLIFFKLSPRMSKLGNISMAFLVGAGTGTIITGAVLGTLFPQISATTSAFSTPENGGVPIIIALIMLIGTVSTLLYFQFTVRTNNQPNSNTTKILSYFKTTGGFFLSVTFGSIFAGVILSSLIALIERLDFIISFIYRLFIG